MSDFSRSYKDIGLIKKDLKKLKKWISLEEDIKIIIKIAIGYLNDNVLSSANCAPRTIFGDFISINYINSEKIFTFKKRVAITNPRIVPKSGARLVYAFMETPKKFFPLLIFPAKNEGKMYLINKKKLPLTETGIRRIIEEKINSLE